MNGKIKKGKTVVLTKRCRERMSVYVNEWQNKEKQDSSFTYTGILSLNCFVSTTVLLFFILPFIYIYRHPFSASFCQYNCLALLYFAIHLHTPASCLLTVLSVQLSCFTLFCHSFTYTGILSLENKVKQYSCTDKTIKRQYAGICK
jgi:predicted membrane protein